MEVVSETSKRSSESVMLEESPFSILYCGRRAERQCQNFCLKKGGRGSWRRAESSEVEQ
jgi:hypothetical protein